MNSSHPLLSHQISVVRKMSPYFEKITVLTGDASDEILPLNVKVINMNWVLKSPIRNAASYLIAMVKIFLRDRPDILFSHMTEVQSLFAIPFTKIMKIPHYLWYAHKNKSFALAICHKFVTSIITSTSGSCPYSGNRVISIGQAIDFDQFFQSPQSKLERAELVHIGRSDPSKRIDLIVDAFAFARIQFPELRLTMIGSPSSHENQMKLEEIKLRHQELIASGSLIFLESVERSAVPKILQKYDLFIHAYNGSLDKSILESIISGIPVVTLNHEFRIEFGTWSGELDSNLGVELISCLTEDPAVLVDKVKAQQKIALESHSLENWIARLAAIVAA